MDKHTSKNPEWMLLIILVSCLIFLLAWYLAELDLILVGILVQGLFVLHFAVQQLRYGKHLLALDEARKEELSALIRIRDSLSRRDDVTHEALRVSLYLSKQVQKIQHKLNASRHTNH